MQTQEAAASGSAYPYKYDDRVERRFFNSHKQGAICFSNEINDLT
jgi:hypothetical protein